MERISGMIKHYEKQFAEIAIHNRYITRYDLSMALRIQERENNKKCSFKQIGEILFYYDIMSPGQIEDVINSVIRMDATMSGKPDTEC